MIGSRKAPPPELDQTPDPAPAPIEKRPAYEAAVFRPSSFASRKAEAEHRNAQAVANKRQMVYIGQTHTLMLKDRRNKDVFVEVELYMERGRPMRRYYKQPGDPNYYPLFDDSPNPRDSVERLEGTVSRRANYPSGRYDPSPEQTTRRP